MVKVLFEPIKTRRQGGSCGLTWRGLTYWLFYAVTHPITSKKVLKIFSQWSHVRISSTNSVVSAIWYGIESTVDSLLTDTSLRRTLSAGPKGVRLRESWLYYPVVLNFNGDQTRISTIGSKVINVLYNTINKTTGKYYSGDFTKTVTLFIN